MQTESSDVAWIIMFAIMAVLSGAAILAKLVVHLAARATEYEAGPTDHPAVPPRRIRRHRHHRHRRSLSSAVG